MPKHMTSYNLLCGKAGCKRNVIRKSAAESFLTGVWSLRSGLQLHLTVPTLGGPARGHSVPRACPRCDGSAPRFATPPT